MDTNKKAYYTEEMQQLIDNYLLDRLDSNSRAAFQEKMKEDPNLRKAVEEQQLITQSIEEYYIRNTLDKFHTSLQKSRKRKIFYSWAAVAASIAIIVGVTSWALFFKENTTEQIFAENFVVDPGLPTTMGNTSNYIFYDGMVSYKRKNYSQAIEKWQKIYPEKSNNDTLNYFLGVANLAEGKSKMAQIYFQRAILDENSAFFEEAQYYYALSQIKDGKVSEAKKSLAKSSFSKSVVLLHQLEKLD